MEILKKWSLFALMLTLSLGFVACSDDDDDDDGSSSSLVGTWYTEVEDSYDSYRIELVLKSDGTGREVYYEGNYGYTDNFEYSVKGDVVTVIYEDDSYSEVERFRFEIVKDKLYLYDYGEDYYSLVFTRQ